MAHTEDPFWYPSAPFRPSATSSCSSCEVYLTRQTTARGAVSVDLALNCCTSLDIPSLSPDLILYSSCMAWNCTMRFLLEVASCTSVIQRLTTTAFSLFWLDKCKEETRAALATCPEESTIACLTYRSMAPSMAESMILARTRNALARYRSTSQVISLVKLEVTMITSSGLHVSATSLMNRYTIRRREASSLMNSFVTPKKTSVASVEFKN
mmetsp:Transcript_3507/g.4659  ORF Transcript_3507/g.4659 Transcript_3507/m.4659 type:complete len:211 (-) Transcript_3507:6-638(-)